MSFFQGIVNLFAKLTGKTPQGKTVEPKHRDFELKGESFSVESEISEALADLALMSSSFPIAGESERARWLDDVSDDFMRTAARKAVSTAFIQGDCLVVPSWNGRNIQNFIVPADCFEIFECAGDEILSCGILLDTKQKGTQTYYLIQSISLRRYTAVDGTDTFENVYETYVTRGGFSGGIVSLAEFPDWKDKYTERWSIRNVDRLLVGRLRSFAYDPLYVNNPKGLPICYGAGQAIAEIHYLLEQMHVEFEFSEKSIMASKRMFETGTETDEFGRPVVEMPRGKRRMFMFTRGSAKGDAGDITEWAPNIRYQAYLDAIDKQEKLVERAVGVSGGIISRSNDISYENVDNVRKSQQKTMGFINQTRKHAERMMTNLVYAWNILANYWEVNPQGDYEVTFDWSNDYIETFTDKSNAILAGQPIGATDAVDYRMFLFNESPEVAREKVAEIQASQSEAPVALEETGE